MLTFKKIQHKIIEIEFYHKFEKIKNRYNNDLFLKPYLDNITIISHLYHKNIQYLRKNKNNIHICMSFNDKYVYQILVGITMVLINCNKNKTFITYHILCHPDVKNNTLSILKSLIYKYSTNLEMIFYNMHNSFINKNNIYFSQAAFYRILTPIFIDIERIIYLDGDTLVLNDLNEMYQLEFNDNYILGFLDVKSNGVDFLGIKSEKYINDGVILINLEKIRNDNKVYELIILSSGNINLPNDDQTVINCVFYPKIGLLPTKFGIWNFSDKKDIYIFVSHLRTPYDIHDLEESFLNPSIIHNDLCWPKIWFKSSQYDQYFTTCKKRKNCFCERYYKLWYYYANKTDYFSNITKIFNK